MGRLVVIDDNDVDREAIRRLVGREYEVVEAATANAGMRECRDTRPDCVLLDYRLPDGSGVDLVGDLVALGLPVVMLSGVGSEAVAVAALKCGAQDYLAKDELTADALRFAVRGAISSFALQRTVQHQRQELEAHATILQRRTEELRVLLDQLPAVVWTTDNTLRVTSASGRDLDVLGLGAWIGRPVDETEPSVVGEHRAALSGVPGRFEVTRGTRSFEGTVQPLRDGRGEVIGTIGLLVDVTEQRRLQEQLRHAQKMDAMGRLAGGVAHDFNNLLTVILTCGSLAAETLPDGHVALEDLQQIVDAGRKAADLTSQLLAFSRRRPSESQPVDVGTQLVSTARMLNRLLGEDVVLEVIVEPDAGAVQIDPGALEQVLVNLAVNARDAMPRGGILVLEASQVDIEVGWEDFRGETIPAGRYVRLMVNDSGSGMTNEVRTRLFEPFFTTKPLGRGTGLGLATVFGIVSQAGGAIHVYSEIGHGTAFHVYLPRTTLETDNPAVAAPPTRLRGTEVILVVEDDPQIRLLTARVLAEYGYQTLVSPSAEEALRVLRNPEVSLDVLLTDVVMPGMPGNELLTLALHIRPGLRAVLMSGYSPHMVRAGAPNHPVLQKPFTPVGLVRAIRALLDAPAPNR